MSQVFNPFDPVQNRIKSRFVVLGELAQAVSSVALLLLDFSKNVQTSFSALSPQDNDILTGFISLVLFASVWSVYLVLQRAFYRNFYFHSKQSGIAYKFVRWHMTKRIFVVLLVANVGTLLYFIYSTSGLYDKVYKFWLQIAILMGGAYYTLYSNFDAWNELESVQNVNGTEYIEDAKRDFIRQACYPTWLDGSPWRVPVSLILYLTSVVISGAALALVVITNQQIDNSMLNVVCLMQPVPTPTARI